MSDTATLTVEPDPAPPSLGVDALREMRRTRQRHRLGDLEWFDAAYRVYLVALFGGGGVLWLSGLVGDTPVTDAEWADIVEHGPAVVGLVAVLAAVMGMRGGANGGPVALEAADVVHVMLAPVPRAAALRRPTVQRVRSVVFVTAVVGAVLGQLAGRRLPGTELAWFGSGLLFGATVGLLWAGAALVAHELLVPRAVASMIGTALVAWQIAAVATAVPGPGDRAGSLALWGARQEVVDLAAVAVALALTGLGLALLARLSLDALARRSTLVAQLRFAVTMQDLRTVILLRRQLTHEHTRPRPWVRLGHGTSWHPVRRRGWQSLLRVPVSRLVRMVALAAGAGACQAAVFRGTTPALLGSMVLLFVLGLEVLEPMSQEIDQPDRHDSFPVERGELLYRHLGAPAVAVVPFAVLGAVAAALFDGVPGGWAPIAIVAIPVAWCGVAGGAVSVVRDAPDPLADTRQQTFMPPEMAGVGTAMRTILPLIVPVLGSTAALVLRESVESDPGAAVGTAIRVAVGLLLVCGFVAVWVRTRDRVHRSVRRFLSEGREQTARARAARYAAPGADRPDPDTTEHDR